jgi:hypothetical protein
VSGPWEKTAAAPEAEPKADKAPTAPKLRPIINLEGLFFAAIVLAVIASTDSTDQHRRTNPHSLGAAITCRIGGPAFCPRVQP